MASVKRNLSGLSCTATLGEQFSVCNITMRELLPFAYGLRDEAVIGSPAWFGSDRFDIVAKQPKDTPRATTALMLRSLLTSEFKLAVHEAQRPQEVYSLEVAKSGAGLKTAAGTEASECKPASADYVRHLICTNVTMADFAQNLQSKIPPSLLDRPVVDRTEMSGSYDIDLAWVLKFDTNTGRPTDDEGGITLFTAIAKLGLRLEPRKLPQPALVIDHAERHAE